MILLIYGLIKIMLYAWIASMIFFVLLSISALMTMVNYQYVKIIELLAFPKLENEMFLKLPLKSSYLLIPVIAILLITMALIIRTKSYHYKKAKFGK